MNVALDDDKAIEQDEAEEHQHAKAIGYHNVPRHHGSAAEDADTHLVRDKHDGPEHEEPARHALVGSEERGVGLEGGGGGGVTVEGLQRSLLADCALEL